MTDDAGRDGGGPNGPDEHGPAGPGPNEPGPETDSEAELEPEAEDEGWRFALDEVGPEAEDPAPEIEPESVDVENALFVVAGVVGTLLLVLSVTI